MSAPTRARTLLLLGVDTEASMVGLRPLAPEAMVYGRVGGGVWGIERIMDACEAHGVRATFFVDALEALHYGDDEVRRWCATALERGHDVQLHVHPIWLGGAFVHKPLTRYGYDRQREALARAAERLERLSGSAPRVHRSGGLWANADTLRAVGSAGMAVDASVAPGYHAYALGGGVAVPTVPRRLGGVAEVPVTSFAQVRLGPWALPRNFDINADSPAELRFVVDRAAAAGAAAISLLMHSFSFIGRNRGSTAFWPEPGEARKFDLFLDAVAARGDVEVVTFGELAARLEAEPALLDGPDFAPTAGVLRTYGRSWARFHTGWRSKAFALGLPLAAAGAAALLVASIWWLIS